MSMTWRQRQKEELREQLFEAALGLFATHGFEATTVLQITEQTGVAKGTFFNHFPSKEHVVAEWYHGITESALSAARERRSASACDAICDLFADMAGQATSQPELLIAKSSHGTDPLLLDAEREQVDRIMTFIHDTLAAGAEAGEVRPGIDLEAFAGLLVAVLTGTSRAWVYSDPRIDFPGLIRQRIRFLFQAVAP